MGAGSAKGVKINDEDFDVENDRFSILSHELDSKAEYTKNRKDDTYTTVEKSKVREKIEALYNDSDEDCVGNEGAKSTKVSVSVTPEKEEEKKRNLFGFSRQKEDEDKTLIFVHKGEDAGKKNGKRETSKGFKLFNFKKDGKKSEEKDEPLDQEINDLQRTFDTLGIVGKNCWDEKGPSKTGEGTSTKKSQSADDIRDLEPMRNRMNQRRRFSRPSHIVAAGTQVIKRGGDGLASSSGGNKRTFKYSWETNNHPSPAHSEEWKYEAVVIEGFDVDKFKKANFQDSLISEVLPGRITSSVISDDPSTSASDQSADSTRSPLIYDTTEQRILASIERDYLSY